MAVPISYSFRNLWTRKLTTVLTAGGMALVAFVFAAVMMIAEGLEKTLVDTGFPDNVIVIRASAETEVSSAIERASAAIIEVQPEVELNSLGEPLAAKETLVLVNLPKRDGDKPAHVAVRGFGPQSLNLRPQIKLIAGRIPRPGSREVMAGKSISESIKGASMGGALDFALSRWDVVGVFDAGNSAFDSELWADGDQVMAAFRRNSYSAVIARVVGGQTFAEFKKILESDPRLTVQVKREIDFYRQQSEVMAKFIRVLGMAMTTFFSIAAILGAMVTMYTAVANRTAEIGTLRALGFQRRSVLLAFLTESLLLGVIGGLVGVGTGSLLQFMTISMMNWETFSELAFRFRLTPQIVLYTLGFACGMGLLGGVLPAWRAAHLTIVDALRES